MFDLGLHSWYEPIERVSKAAEKQQANLLTPILGELISVKDKLPSKQWWKPLINPTPAE
jgi:hypothetical protein